MKERTHVSFRDSFLCDEKEFRSIFKIVYHLQNLTVKSF